MTEVAVLVFHPEPAPDAGPLTRATADARGRAADRHVRGFLEAGATRATIVTDPPDDRSFGARLRDRLDDIADGGLIAFGSGAIPLASQADRRAFVAAAAADRPRALTNNRFSADVIAIARANESLRDLPDLPTDNGLPRWLQEIRRIPVEDLRRRTRLGLDIDGPLDLVLLGGRWPSALGTDVTQRIRAAIDGVRRTATDPLAELVVTGRMSAANLAWLEARTASRTRALIEERGLRVASTGQRPAASVLGALLDRDGPGSLGAHLTRLGDAAVVDTRVLLAHRLGADERRWPAAEDRFASDLLLHERIDDPWLRDLTRSVVDASIPVLLGGHTLVGPGLRLAVRRARSASDRHT